MEPAPWHYGNRRYSIQLSDTGVAGLLESPLDMSSLTRRACYKCGNVGHYAGQQHLPGEEGMQADIMQKYAPRQNAFATTASLFRHLDPCSACANPRYRQTAWYAPITL